MDRGFTETRSHCIILVFSSHDLITQLARTISCNGNFLINVGPTHDGRIVPIFEERLNELGEFLKRNGEAVYKTKPWIYTNDSNVWYVLNDLIDVNGRESFMLLLNMDV